MRFPSITPYLESVSNLDERLRTLHGIKPILDKGGEAIFYSSKGSIVFLIENNGTLSSMRCFTSVGGYERLSLLSEAGIVNGQFYENEMFVFNNDEIGDYYTIFIDQTANSVNEEQKDKGEFGEGLIATEQNGLWGYTDSLGKFTIPALYDFVGEFSEGRATVCKDGFFGLIDRDGKIVIDTVFDEISWDGSALAYVDKCGKWGCYDRLGREVVRCTYDWVGEFSNSLLLVKKNGKYGYVNIQGEEVIPLVYDSATSFDDNGIASVIICGEPIMINLKGEIER